MDQLAVDTKSNKTMLMMMDLVCFIVLCVLCLFCIILSELEDNIMYAKSVSRVQISF